MINRVIISGILEDNELELIKTPKGNLVEAMILTHNSSKTEVKRVKIVMYGKLAYHYFAHQHTYKENLCMYFGEVSYNEERNETRIKINEPIQILASVGE